MEKEKLCKEMYESIFNSIIERYNSVWGLWKDSKGSDHETMRFHK